jgi:hypothetical protein
MQEEEEEEQKKKNKEEEETRPKTDINVVFAGVQSDIRARQFFGFPDDERRRHCASV